MTPARVIARFAPTNGICLVVQLAARVT